MIKDAVEQAITDALPKHTPFTLLSPKDRLHGDYALNSFQLGDVNIDELVQKLSQNPSLSKVVRMGSFINLFVDTAILIEEVQTICLNAEYGATQSQKNKRIVVEYAHPNTHKLFHIGHTRNISLGESLSRILSNAGAEVIRANYQGDVGLHIAKCLYGIQQQGEQINTLKNLDEKIAFLGKTYTFGTDAYEKDPQAKEKINAINKQIYEKHPDIMDLYEKTRMWSLEYYDRIYKRLDTVFDRLFFESEVTQSGLSISRDALKMGILSESEGAVVFNGKQYGLDTRVFINSLGLPTYEAKELGLAKLEFTEFGTIDKCIHVVTPEQSSFFKVTFKVQELLDEKLFAGKQMHYAYEFVDLKGDKMSSRTGNIVTGEWLIDTVKKAIQDTFAINSQKAEVLAVGAVKYAFLKVDAKRKILFDIKQSIAIHGNSGPYMQYTYARSMSVLKKDTANHAPVSKNYHAISSDEMTLIRTLVRFPEVVDDAARMLAPHVVCTYLYELSQAFNTFYEKHPILKAPDEQKVFRLMLTRATAQTIKNGLHLLGIALLDTI